MTMLTKHNRTYIQKTHVESLTKNNIQPRKKHKTVQQSSHEGKCWNYKKGVKRKKETK